MPNEKPAGKKKSGNKPVARPISGRAGVKPIKNAPMRSSEPARAKGPNQADE